MDSRSSDRHDGIIPLHGRRREPEPAPSRGPDLRNGDSTLAREFAQRALAPLVKNLRNRHGQIDARKVAPALGLTIAQLATCMELPEEVLKRSPPPEELEAQLEPFSMVIAIVRDAYGADNTRVRQWLRTPRPELEGRTPNETLCMPAGIQRVIRFVLGAWLGNAD